MIKFCLLSSVGDIIHIVFTILCLNATNLMCRYTICSFIFLGYPLPPAHTGNLKLTPSHLPSLPLSMISYQIFSSLGCRPSFSVFIFIWDTERYNILTNSNFEMIIQSYIYTYICQYKNIFIIILSNRIINTTTPCVLIDDYKHLDSYYYLVITSINTLDMFGA